MSQGAWILAVALAFSGAFGLVRASRDGRFRGTRSLRVAAPPAPGRAVPTEATDVTGSTEAAATSPVGLDARPEGVVARSVLSGTVVEGPLGERATLLQFSSAFCAPCRATRRILGDVADTVPGVRHIELDAEDHLVLVRRVGVLRTPTTLILDAEGVEVSRASGAPRKDAVLATLARVVTPV